MRHRFYHPNSLSLGPTILDGTEAHHLTHVLRARVGDLDKLALINIIMGNSYRRDANYLLTPHWPHVRMIDHSHVFRDYGLSASIPKYIHRAGQIADGDSDLTLDKPLHPAALKWLQGLKANVLATQMNRMHMSKQQIALVSGALMAIQKRLSEYPHASRLDLYQVPDIRYPPEEEGDPAPPIADAEVAR